MSDTPPLRRPVMRALRLIAESVASEGRKTVTLVDVEWAIQKMEDQPDESPR